MTLSNVVASQNFNWHDSGEGAAYVFGEDGYLKMDGANGRVVCSRYLTEPIRDAEGALDLSFRVLLGKRYHVRLYGAGESPVAECQIDEEGEVSFARRGHYVKTGKVLRYHTGRPYENSETRPTYVVESDEHRFRFERFNFSARSLSFLLDGSDGVDMAGCLDERATEVNRVELRTSTVGVGSMIRLKEYVEERRGAEIERERFQLHWNPVPRPPEGMPDDNVCDTTMRPVDHRWLETSTKYGYVKATIPPLLNGAIEFEMKTPEVAVESCLILEEYSGVIKYGNMQLGLLRRNMILTSPSPEIERFDQNIEVADDRVYRIKVEWDAGPGTCRMWVDDVAMSRGGSEVLPMGQVARRGVDTITLHTGRSNARLTSIQRREGLRDNERDVPPLLTYWAKFRVLA